MQLITNAYIWFFLHIFELRFTRCNAEQQIQGIELQEKEVPKD